MFLQLFNTLLSAKKSYYEYFQTKRNMLRMGLFRASSSFTMSKVSDRIPISSNQF
jgi:hypothetical protein